MLFPPLSLPAETWMQIIRKDLDEKEWRALSRTSSFFRSASQAALYETIRFSRCVDSPDILEPSNHSLAVLLEERLDLARHVRFLDIYSFRGWRAPVKGVASDSFEQHPLLSKIELFPNLRELRVSGFDIDSGFCSALLSHPKLSFVGFAHCRIDPGLLIGAISDVSDSLFTKVDITDPVGQQEGWGIVAPARLQDLRVTAATRFLNAMLLSLMKYDKSTFLTTLTLEFGGASLPASIVQFLTSSPQVRRLSIICGELHATDMVLLRSLPTNSIPLLQEFTGWANICQVLAPGRPVHTVTIEILPNFAFNVLVSLEQSSIPVSDLKIKNLYATDHGSFLQHAPTSICRFSWDQGDKDGLMSCSSALSRMKNLRVIAGHIAMPAVTDAHAERENIVQKLSIACPSVREFDFQCERWMRGRQDSWECYFSQ